LELSSFNGFPTGKVRLTRIPATFFSELLPEIDHLAEMKVTLYVLWFLDQQEGNIRCIHYTDFTNDLRLLYGLAETMVGSYPILQEALERAVQRGTLLRVGGERVEEGVYFLNSPRGRAAVASLHKGEWSLDKENGMQVNLAVERPTIFQLYEKNIGPLTPMIADILKDAEDTYPAEWIEGAMEIAVENNARKWSYIKAILRDWKERGHGTDRGSTQEDRRRYSQGEFAEYIEH
jgi:DNA replication protein